MADEEASVDMTRSAMARTAATWPRHKARERRRKRARSSLRRQRPNTNVANGSDRV